MNWDIFFGADSTSFWFVCIHIFVLDMAEDDDWYDV